MWGADMNKSDVIAHFGSVGAVAAALKIKGAAVSQWGALVPARRAYQLERLTNGALKVDESLYSDAVRIFAESGAATDKAA